MDAIDSRKTLWASVSSLMEHRWGGENLSRLAREAGIGPGSATRLKQQTTSVGLELVDRLAFVFGVEAWQLLVPGFDASNQPTLLPMSEGERAFYERVLAASRELRNAGE